MSIGEGGFQFDCFARQYQSEAYTRRPFRVWGDTPEHAAAQLAADFHAEERRTGRVKVRWWLLVHDHAGHGVARAFRYEDGEVKAL